jgi:tetratricopeptide (TPR) repeat protein
MNKQTDLLRGACLLGLVVFLCLAGALTLLSLLGDIPLFPFPSGTFAQALNAYDEALRENPGLSFRQRNGLLNSLEKKALDTGNVLSVLKRRRFAALHDASGGDAYLEAYIEAAERVRQLYPHSAQIGALAAEALILNAAGRPLLEEEAAELQELAVLMSGGALQDLSLACSVYSGVMGDPASARFLPRELFTLLCSLTNGEERERYLVNACIRTLLEEDAAGTGGVVNGGTGGREAVAMVNALFDSPPLLDETFRFGGEFFYDHGNFLRAAELFSVFTDDQGLARQSDALWLGNFVEQARILWRVAASGPAVSDPAAGAAAFDAAGPADSGVSDAASLRVRDLYNLAATEPDAGEAGQWLEQLFAADSAGLPGRVFGVIRYSRLVPLNQALVILEGTDRAEGLFDLELLRRKSESWTVDRTVAETWNLLNRHSGDSRLFEWAAWYFDFQRRYDEALLVLRNAAINRVEGPWSGLHRAFAQLRAGDLDEAEKTLRSIIRSPGEGGVDRQRPLWQAPACLGLLLEKRGNFREALECYETAAGRLAAGGKLLPEDLGIPAAGIAAERRDAARIQVRIAGVLRSLGRGPESRRPLEYALDLDPENLEARLELRRLDVKSQ